MPINRNVTTHPLIEQFNASTHRAKPRSIESPIQQACVRWFRLQHPSLCGVFFSTPNGGHRSAITAKILKAEGTLAGVSDLLLLVPSGVYHGLCIEMKTPERGSKQSDAQKAFQIAVETQGYKYAICRSLEEFISEIGEYLNN